MAKKIDQVGLVSDYWSVSGDFGRAAKEWLENADLAECAARQSEHEARAASSAPQGSKAYQTVGKVAIVPVTGLMTKKPTSASYFFGGTSTVRTRQVLNQVLDDASVDSVLMVFETPGGQVEGLPELAATVRAVDAVKPVHAFVEDGCFSAGYFIASQCRSVSVNESGRVGCLGSMAYGIDDSAAFAMTGRKAYVFTEAPFKAMGYEGIPFTPEFVEERMKVVRGFHESFLSHVMAGRGMTDEQVRPLFDGKTFFADQALDLGLVDCVCSYEACLETISAGLTPGWDAGESGEIGDNSNMSTEPKNLGRLIGDAVNNALVKAGLVKDQSAGGPALVTAPPEDAETVVDLSPVLAETNAKLAEANKRLEEMSAKARAELVTSKLKACEDKFEPVALDAVKSAYTLAAQHGDDMVAAVDALVGVVSASPLTSPVIPDDAKAVDGDTKTPKTTSAKRKRELIAAAGVTPKETK